MNSLFKRLFEKPIFILLAVNIIVGLFIFRDFGYSWDEPLFYDYGNALGYAYSPTEWFSSHFDVANSYGATGDGNTTRGTANFLLFQLGVYFLYRLSTRWMKSYAALSASALFAWQPMLWGHAFINPKDP